MYVLEVLFYLFFFFTFIVWNARMHAIHIDPFFIRRQTRRAGERRWQRAVVCRVALCVVAHTYRRSFGTTSSELTGRAANAYTHTHKTYLSAVARRAAVASSCGHLTSPVGHGDALVVEPHEFGVVEENDREAGQVNDLWEQAGVYMHMRVAHTYTQT